MTQLVLKFENVELDEPLCTASVATCDFSGKGRYWMPASEFIPFATALAKFPLDHRTPIKADWYCGDLSLQIERISRSGLFRVRARIAEPGAEWAESRVEFHTQQAELDIFRQDILAAIASSEGEARLFSSRG